MGQQIGSTVIKRVALTDTNTGAHAAGDVVAKFNLAPIDGRTGVALLKQIAVFDDSGQADTFTFLFFDGALTGTYTYNSAPAPSAADKARLLGSVTFGATDWKTAGGDSYGCKECAVGIRHDPAVPGQGAPTTPGELTVVILAGGTPTFAANALQLAFGLLPDGA